MTDSPHAAGDAAEHRKHSRLFILLHFLYSFSYWNYLIFLPVYFDGIGISGAGIGRLLSVFPITNLILLFPLGMLADRISSKLLVVAGSIGCMIFAVAMFFSHTTPAIFLSLIAGGLSYAAYFMGFNALFFKYVADEDRGFSTAWFFAGGTAGFGGGMLLGGLTIEKIGIESLFYLGFFAGAVMLAASLLAPKVGMFKFSLGDYIDDLKSPAALLVIFAMFVINTHSGVEQMALGLFMEKSLGLSRSDIGFSLTIVAIWMTLWVLWSGKHFNSNKRPIIVLGAAVAWSGIFQFMTVYSRDFTTVTAFRLAHSFGDSFFNVASLMLIGTIFHRKRVGGNFGFVNTINTGAVLLAYNISGLVMRNERYDIPFKISGAVMVAAGLLLLILRDRLKSELHTS